MVGKPIGLSCYTIYIEKINLKNAGKTKIYVTPFNVMILIFSLILNGIFSLYYANEIMAMANTKENDKSESIFNYGLMLTLILIHVLSMLSTVVVFINRKLIYDILTTINYVDQKVFNHFFFCIYKIWLYSIFKFSKLFVVN